MKSLISLSVIFLSFTLIRSLKDTRCGEVYKPTLYPAVFSIEATKAHVDPLPLVPATCTLLKPS